MGNTEILGYLPEIAILVFASVFGMIRMFKKTVPMYFQLTICAVWSFAIQMIYSVLIIVCANDYRSDNNLGFLGMATTFIFLASANFGQFNTLVDEGSKKLRPIRLAALAAPIFVAAFYLYIILHFEQTLWFKFIFAVVVIPVAASQYFNVKFILMKDDGTGFIRGVKPLNIVSFLASICYLLYIYADCKQWETVGTLASFLSVLLVSSIVFLGDWGRKQWFK